MFWPEGGRQRLKRNAVAAVPLRTPGNTIDEGGLVAALWVPGKGTQLVLPPDFVALDLQDVFVINECLDGNDILGSGGAAQGNGQCASCQQNTSGDDRDLCFCR